MPRIILRHACDAANAVARRWGVFLAGGDGRKGPGGLGHYVAETEFVQTIKGLAELPTNLQQVRFLRNDCLHDRRPISRSPNCAQSAALDRTKLGRRVAGLLDRVNQQRRTIMTPLQLAQLK